MKTQLTRLFSVAALAVTASAAGTVMAQDGSIEPERRTLRYEDDAWYDVSEWFDNNDYNPTDEAIGRWDDEVFHFHDNVTSSDEDNDDNILRRDRHVAQDYRFGSDENTSNQYTPNEYTQFIDTNGDHLYEGYAVYRDTDSDGVFDTYRFFALVNDPDSRRRGEQLAKAEQQRARTISGEVIKTEKVERTEKSQKQRKANRVAVIQTDDGKQVHVGIGSAADLKIAAGDSLTASGAMTNVDGKQVLLASNIQINGQAHSVDRSFRSYVGTVERTRTAKMGNQTRLVVKLKTSNGKMLTVDMGNAETAKQPKEGQQLTVQGVPVQVGDRVLLVAKTPRS